MSTHKNRHAQQKFPFIPLCFTALALLLSGAISLSPANALDARADSLPENSLHNVGHPPVVFPDPTYNLTLEEVYVPLEGISREYRVAWVSDLHMITDRKAGGIAEKSVPIVTDRYDNFAVTTNGVHAEELWPVIVKCLNEGRYDAVIFGGDLVDYCSSSNMKALKKGFDELLYDKEQIMYIRADHDYAIWHSDGILSQWDAYVLHKGLDGDRLDKKYLDLGEFAVIGINESHKNITEDALSTVEAQYEKATKEKKPVVIATHVPYGSAVDPTLQEWSMHLRNSRLYWRGDELWQPNDAMERYFTFMLGGEKPRTSQVLAGHLHASWDGMITEQTREHIFSPAFRGTIGVIYFVPAASYMDASTYRAQPGDG